MKKKIEELSYFDVIFTALLHGAGLAGFMPLLQKVVHNWMYVVAIWLWATTLFTHISIVNIRVYRITKYLNEKEEKEEKGE